MLHHHHHHHHHLEIYSAPITFAAIGAVQKSYEQQQTLTNIKSKAKIIVFKIFLKLFCSYPCYAYCATTMLLNTGVATNLTIKQYFLTFGQFPKG